MKGFFYTIRSKASSLLTALLLVCASIASAQTASLTVQGVLTKSDGSAVDDGIYEMTFRLWNDPDATAPANKKHQETISDVETVGGVYSVTLGIRSTPLAASFTETYWLGVSMNQSTVELLPRPRLTHAPYALAIKGNHNVFGSTGPVIADALRVRGGPANASMDTTGNGYSFLSASGDGQGGMFSDGANNIEFWAGGSKRAKLTNSVNEWYGNAVNFGSFVSNDLTVNGNALINNIGNNTGNLTVKNGLQVDGSETVNGSLFVHSSHFVDLNSTIGGGQTVNGSSLTKGFAKTHGANNGGGFTFFYPNGVDDTDSGLFGAGDGIVQIRANNTVVAQFTQAQGYTNQCCNTPSSVKFFGIQKGPDQPQVEWDEVSGQLQVDNSSRRLKRNIQPMMDDFSLILKVQPKLYNRIGYPDSLVELGYIAEEFDSLGLKRLVHYNSKNEIIGVNYKKVSIYLAEIVKSHQTDIEKMKAEIAALKRENEALTSKNAALSADNSSLQQQQVQFSAQLESLDKRMKAIETLGNSRK